MLSSRSPGDHERFLFRLRSCVELVGCLSILISVHRCRWWIGNHLVLPAGHDATDVDDTRALTGLLYIYLGVHGSDACSSQHQPEPRYQRSQRDDPALPEPRRDRRPDKDDQPPTCPLQLRPFRCSTSRAPESRPNLTASAMNGRPTPRA